VSLTLRQVHKSFGGVKALRGVDFSVSPGEIVGLVGGNGAGKSTLMKLAAGIHQPDEGTVSIDGQSPHSPAHAIHLGVSLVRQELIQALDLDVGMNVMLGHEPHRWGVIDRAALYERAAEALSRVGRDLDPHMLLGKLSPGQRQRVEIARALSLKAKVLLLDEPTATLNEGDATRLFSLLRELKAAGLTIVYISHRLGEILAITDRVVCMRDGKVAGEAPTEGLTQEHLVQMLAGEGGARPVRELPPPSSKVLLSVRGRVSFDLRPGEVLGLAGLVGAGRSRLFRELFGLQRPVDLTIEIDGKPVVFRHPRDAMNAGVALVPEERRTDGLILDMPVEQNLALPSLTRFRLEDEAALARPMMKRFGLRPGALAVELSGGNQQKIVLGKWIARKPRILMLDEPTRGLDIAARRDVHETVRELAEQGMAVLVASSEAEEVAELSHRAIVLNKGRSCGELSRADINEHSILRFAAA
jgi:ribose transport system ATP-binding protein